MSLEDGTLAMRYQTTIDQEMLCNLAGCGSEPAFQYGQLPEQRIFDKRGPVYGPRRAVYLETYVPQWHKLSRVVLPALAASKRCDHTRRFTLVVVPDCFEAIRD